MDKKITIRDVQTFLIQTAGAGTRFIMVKVHHLRAGSVRAGLRHVYPALPGGPRGA